MMHRPVLTPPAAHSPAHADHATQAPIGAVGAGRTEGPAEEKSFDAAMVQAAMLIAASKMSGNVKLAKAMTRATRSASPQEAPAQKESPHVWRRDAQTRARTRSSARTRA